MSDQPEAQQSDPAKTTANISGGVNTNAGQIDVGADVVGRDKVTSAGGHIIHAEPGAIVNIGGEKKQPPDLPPDEEIATLKRIPPPILAAVLGAIAVIVAALITAVVPEIIKRTPVPPLPTPSCISADDLIVTFHILKGTSEIATLSSGEIASIEPNLTIYLQAEITPVTISILPPLECTWTNTGIASEGSLLHNAGCKIDYRSGRSVDAVSMQLSQSSCPALAPYPFFITPKWQLTPTPTP